MWEGPFWEGVWPCLDPWDSERLRTASTFWTGPGKYGPHGELLFFLVKKEPVVASDDVSSNSFVSAETLKACALIGLHFLAAEGEAGSSGSQSHHYLGGMWTQGSPNSPEWISSWSASETTFGCEECMSTTTSTGPLKSLGRIGQARW